MTFKIVRYFFNGGNETIKEGLSLEEAQEHCQDDESSSKTATSDTAIALTEEKGQWFDGYHEE